MLRFNPIVPLAVLSLLVSLSSPSFAQSNNPVTLPSENSVSECLPVGYGVFVVNAQPEDIEQLAVAAGVPIHQITLCQMNLGDTPTESLRDRQLISGAQVQLTATFNQEHWETFQLVRKLKNQGYRAYLTYTSDEPIPG